MVDIVVNNNSKSQKPEPKRSAGNRRMVSKIIYILAILLILGVAAYFFWQYQDLKNNPDKAMQQEVTRLTQSVSRLMALPSDEVPTVATIEDRSKLDNQPFFEDAKDGDKILIYTEAKKAIVYREGENKIINVGPIAINADNAAEE